MTGDRDAETPRGADAESLRVGPDAESLRVGPDAERLRVGPYVRPRHAAPGDDPDDEAPDRATGRASVMGRLRARRGAVGRASAPTPSARTGAAAGVHDPADPSAADTQLLPLVPVAALAGGDAAGRRGPELLAADSWDTTAEPDTVDDYHGRRRALFDRRWLGLALVVVALAALVAVPLILLGLDDPDPAAAPVGSASPDEPLLPPATGDPTPPPTEMSAVSGTPTAPGTTTTSATTRPPRRPPTRTTSPPRPTGATTVTTPAGPQPPPPPPPPPAFNPVTIEAEAGGGATTLGGSAWVWNYANASGGRIVRNVGDWGSRSGDGWLRFNSVSVPSAGAYRIAIHYVHPDNEGTRRAVVTVSGAAPVEVTFSGNSTCCRVTVVTVTISAGTHTVTIANPSGRAPSIDKIVVSR
jgi:hypothetical protein